MTTARAAETWNWLIAGLSRASTALRYSASLAAVRLGDLPRGWHHAIRALLIVLVLWVAGSVALDRVVAAGNRTRGEVAAVAPSGPAPVVGKLQAKKPFVV